MLKFDYGRRHEGDIFFGGKNFNNGLILNIPEIFIDIKLHFD